MPPMTQPGPIVDGVNPPALPDWAYDLVNVFGVVLTVSAALLVGWMIYDHIQLKRGRKR